MNQIIIQSKVHLLAPRFSRLIRSHEDIQQRRTKQSIAIPETSKTLLLISL